MSLLVILLSIFPISFALDPVRGQEGTENLPALLLNLTNSLEPTVDCFDPDITPACTEITRTYCQKLKANNGKATDSFGTVNLGSSERSALPQTEKEDLDNLVRSRTELSPELQTKLSPHFSTLAKLLSEEKDEEAWYKSVSEVRRKMAKAVEELGDARARLALTDPRLTQADREAERKKQRALLMDELTAAKMRVSPKWQIIQRIFSSVKKDLETVILEMPLSAVQKELRLKNLRSTELSPPFGVSVGGELGEILQQDCRSNMMNAMFLPNGGHTGKVTICAGLVNGLATESSAYFVLAHELAHSFDQQRMLQQEREQSPEGKKISAIIDSNGDLPCEKWTALKSNAHRDSSASFCGTKNYQKFMTCLAGDQHDPDDFAKLAASSKGNSIDALNSCAVTDKKQGLAYMNPELLSERNTASILTPPGNPLAYDGSPIKGLKNHFAPAFEVTQELRCGSELKCSEIVSRRHQCHWW